MKIIYKYITVELITPLLFGAAAFTGIFVGTDLLFDLIDYYNTYGVRLLTLAQLFFLNLPAIVVITLPMATLLGTIMAFGRLSGDSEITALRAGGISIYRLVLPALLIGLLMTFITIGVNEYVVPRANYLNNQIVWDLKNMEQKPMSQNNLLLPSKDRQGRPDFFLFTSYFDGQTGKMNDVIFQDFENGEPVLLIEAEEAVWREDGGWVFRNGRIMHLKAGERIPGATFTEYTKSSLSYEPAQVAKLNKDIEDLNFMELRERIELQARQGKNVNEELVNLHQRLSIPFANFIFALLAAVLGIQPQRSGGTATGMGISIGVIFIYYTLMTVGSAMGEQGTLPPMLGAWIQNFIFFIIGSVMLYKLGK
ncbi:MAG: LptF/LptG family permease [Halanaerobiales bacterium]